MTLYFIPKQKEVCIVLVSLSGITHKYLLVLIDNIRILWRQLFWNKLFIYFQILKRSEWLSHHGYNGGEDEGGHPGHGGGHPGKPGGQRAGGCLSDNWYHLPEMCQVII